MHDFVEFLWKLFQSGIRFALPAALLCALAR